MLLLGYCRWLLGCYNFVCTCFLCPAGENSVSYHWSSSKLSMIWGIIHVWSTNTAGRPPPHTHTQIRNSGDWVKTRSRLSINQIKPRISVSDGLLTLTGQYTRLHIGQIDCRQTDSHLHTLNIHVKPRVIYGRISSSSVMRSYIVAQDEGLSQQLQVQILL